MDIDPETVPDPTYIHPASNGNGVSEPTPMERIRALEGNVELLYICNACLTGATLLMLLMLIRSRVR